MQRLTLPKDKNPEYLAGIISMVKMDIYAFKFFYVKIKGNNHPFIKLKFKEDIKP